MIIGSVELQSQSGVCKNVNNGKRATCVQCTLVRGQNECVYAVRWIDINVHCTAANTVGIEKVVRPPSIKIR